MPPSLAAEVRRYQGIPWIHINGQPLNSRIYIRAIERFAGHDRYGWDEVLNDYRVQARHDAGLFFFYSNCAGDFYQRLWGDVWLPPSPAPGIAPAAPADRFDFHHLDRFMEFFQSECPGVLAIPALYMSLPTWWEDQHPEELQRFADGRTRTQFSGLSGAFRDQVVSLASEAWYADMTYCLERYLDYAEARYGHLIPGYLIGGGITHEWGILGSFDFVDYSEPMLRYWRQWVARRYPHGVPYASEAIPSPEQRLAAAEAGGEVRDPRVSQVAIDFQLCLSDLVAERIIGFCQTVKRKTAGRNFTATFYGYTLTCREGGLERLGQFLGRYGCGGFQGGHLALAKVLASPAVDIITSPYSYANRRLGTGDLQPHYPETSVLRAGKVSLLQDDNHSWMGFDAKVLDNGFYPEPENYLKQLQRAFARRLCGDDQLYQMDLVGGNYDAPQILAELEEEQAIFDRYAQVRAAALAEILIVVDEIAIAYLSLQSALPMRNVYRQTTEWARCGVPFHVVLASDATTMDLAPYRLVILTNAVVQSPPLTALVSRCRREERSLLFLPGCGVIGPHGPDPVAADAWIGVPADGARLTVRDRGPTFDARAASAPLSWDELGQLAVRAGCHRYGTVGERIWRSPRLLGVHVTEGGPHHLRLPAGARIAEPIRVPGPWSQTEDRLEINCGPGHTALFLLDVPASQPARSPC